MRTVAVADVGGTHARFALAQIDSGRVVSLGEPVKLQTSDHASFQLAWEEFGRRPKCDRTSGIDFEESRFDLRATDRMHA